MRQFAGSGFRIWNLSREAKVIYSCFCVLSLAAMGSSLLLYEDLVGPSLRSGHSKRVSAYYSEAPAPPPPAAAAAPTGGPTIALPDDAEAGAGGPAAVGKLTITVPYRKLLEVTHFHLFTVPVFLLILTHLFMLTGASASAKLGWIVLGWLFGTLHIAAPWLVRYGGSAVAGIFPLSGAGFFVASLVLCVYPAAVMWRRPPRPAQPPGPGS